MKVDMPLDYLGHESIHGAPAGRNVVQHIRTLRLLVKRPFDRVHLASNSSYAIEQFFLLFGCMSHKNI